MRLHIILTDTNSNNDENLTTFDGVIWKIERVAFFQGPHCRPMSIIRRRTILSPDAWQWCLLRLYYTGLD